MSSITTGILEGGMDWAMVFMGAGIAFCLIALRHADKYINILICSYLIFFIGGFLEGAIPAFLFTGSLLIAATQFWIRENGQLDISIMAVAVGMYLSLKMTIPIFIGGLIYLKVPQKINDILVKQISDIKSEIKESEKLRSDAKILLDNAHIKLDLV